MGVKTYRPPLVDVALAAVLGIAAIVVSAVLPGQRSLDVLGALLLVGGYGCLAWRRRYPAAVLAFEVAILVPYNLLQYRHETGIAAGIVALFTFSALGERLRVAVVTVVFLAATTISMVQLHSGASAAVNVAAAVGWIFATVIAGQAWHSHRAYIAEILDRAERAERSREEEVRRRSAEVRVCIARDLHDLLAHSITVIGVQAGVAAHLAAEDPPVDRAVLAQALEAVAESCREARLELRATLTVLRSPDDETDTAGREALPSLAGVPALVDAVRAAGLRVDACVEPPAALAPEAGAAVYRIVQEALTNVVKHAGAASVTVEVRTEGDDVLVRVADDGTAGRDITDKGGGFGLLGMAERARGVGGTLTAGRAQGGGFTVSALLPASRAAAEGAGR